MKWTRLNKVLEHKFFARIYIWIVVVPVLANLAEKFPSEVKLELSKGQILTIQMELPFTWYVLYFAALLSYIAYGIYIYFCPQFLRSFQSAGDALQAGLTIQYIRQAQQGFVASYFKSSYQLTHVETEPLRRMFYQLRTNQLSFEAQLPRPDGNTLEGILSAAVLITEEGGSFYRMSDGAKISRDQLFKHLYHDLISLQDVCFPRARLAATALIGVALCLSILIITQGSYYVLTSIFK